MSCLYVLLQWLNETHVASISHQQTLIAIKCFYFFIICFYIPHHALLLLDDEQDAWFSSWLSMDRDLSAKRRSVFVLVAWVKKMRYKGQIVLTDTVQWDDGTRRLGGRHPPTWIALFTDIRRHICVSLDGIHHYKGKDYLYTLSLLLEDICLKKILFLSPAFRTLYMNTWYAIESVFWLI